MKLRNTSPTESREPEQGYPILVEVEFITVRRGAAITAIQLSSTITGNHPILMPVFLWGENALSRLQECRVCLTVFGFLNMYIFLSQNAHETLYKEKKKTIGNDGFDYKLN